MERWLDAVLDVMHVPVTGDPNSAVRPVAREAAPRDIECEVLVAGGGMGGVAAALAAARRGCRTCLIEETDWLGGQLSAQGVSALDEHEHIETFGGTASYYALRERLRAHYRDVVGERAGATPAFNPGDCWVSRLAFEPRVGTAAMGELLAPHVASGRLALFLRSKTIAVDESEDRIRWLRAMNLDDGTQLRFRAGVVIDATELGELLPLAGAEYRVGAESIAETGEPHAQPHEAKAHCVQSFTYTFAAERRPRGESHVVAEPARYRHDRTAQPYSLTIDVHGGEIYGEQSGRLAYRLYETMPGTKGGLWSYRRLLAASVFGPATNELSLFNWPGNDYRDRGIVDVPAAAAALALQEAKQVSLGFLHWLQTEAPAEGDRIGAPELMLRADVMGSADGLSKHPYIRESRRIVARSTVLEQDVSADLQPGPLAAPCADSVGIGWYPIDIHRAGADDVGLSCRTRPFQIPLGALLPVRIANLIAAAKNIGTTHLTNGCFRLHPVEWNIGESAGALAAFALGHGMTPAAVRSARLAEFQRSLLDEGVPLAWAIDVPFGDPAAARAGAAR